MSDSVNYIIPNEELISLVVGFLDEGLDVRLRAKGNSMLPFVRNGRDCLLLKKAGAAAAGDVVLARVDNGGYVIHRIIGIDGDKIVLKGDGNYRGVEHCRTSDVLASVYGVVRPGGRTVSPSRWRNWHKLPLAIRRPVVALVKRLSK